MKQSGVAWGSIIHIVPNIRTQSKLPVKVINIHTTLSFFHQNIVTFLPH